MSGSGSASASRTASSKEGSGRPSERGDARASASSSSGIRRRRFPERQQRLERLQQHGAAASLRRACEQPAEHREAVVVAQRGEQEQRGVGSLVDAFAQALQDDLGEMAAAQAVQL